VPDKMNGENHSSCPALFYAISIASTKLMKE